MEATVTDADRYFDIDEESGQIRVIEVEFPDPIPAEVSPNCDSDTATTNVPACPDMDDPTLDYEGTNTFSLIVTAEDVNDSTRKVITTVNVSLENLNEMLYFDRASREAVMGANSPIMYGEQRTNAVVQLAGVEPDGHALHWEVTGPDASDFMIMDADDINDGKDRVQLMFKSQPDFENPKGSATTTTDADGNTIGVDDLVVGDTYVVMVRATEMTAVGDGPKMADELEVTVQVTNAKEAGMVGFTLLQPEVGTPITATLSDLDNVDTGETPTWTWYRAKVTTPNPNPSTDTDRLASEWQMIEAEDANPTGASYTPQGVNSEASPATETKMDEDLHLLARVEYTDGAGTSTAVGITAYATRANVTNAMNNSPDFNANKTTRMVPEDTAVGMPVGDPVDVDQNEDDDVLTYSLVTDSTDNEDANDVDDDFFSIDQATGQITVKKKLSAEMDGRTYPDGQGATTPAAPGKYVVVVRATDPSGEATGEEDRDDITVIITATDVNEAPTVTGMAELMVNEADSGKKNRYVGLGSTEDEDGNITENSTITNVYRRSEEDAVDRAIWPEPIAGDDGHLFEYSVHTDGISRRLHFIDAPNYEDPMDVDGDNVYEVTIKATDTAGAMGEKSVRITVMNVDEMGKLTLSPDQPDDGMPVIATLEDPDGVVSITNWEWFATSTRTRTDAVRVSDATTAEYIGRTLATSCGRRSTTVMALAS